VRPSINWRARMTHQLRRASPQETQSTIRSEKHPNRAASVTRSTSASLPPCHALSAAGRPPITYALPNPGRWAPNPAVSGSCRSATRTIERSITPVTSECGGKSAKIDPVAEAERLWQQHPGR
jgi:hypothetical protein